MYLSLTILINSGYELWKENPHTPPKEEEEEEEEEEEKEEKEKKEELPLFSVGGGNYKAHQSPP